MGKIFVSFTIVSTANFFLVARENLNGAEVYRSAVLTPPHIQRNIEISPVNPVMHSVELWTTLDNINLDTLRARCSVDASMNNKVSFTPVTFIPGNGRGAPHYDPIPDQTQWANPDITLTYDVATDSYNFVLFKSGFGAVDIGTHLGLLTDGHGLEWTDGLVFSEGEEYTLMINELITVAESSGGGSSFPSGIVEITEDTAFSSTHYGKMLIINGIDPVVILSIAAMAAIPDNTMFSVSTHNGTQNYGAIDLPSGAYCLISRVQRNTVYIRPGEQVQFIKSGVTLVIVNGGSAFAGRGARVYADGTAPINALPETGVWYLKVDYPGLFDEYVNTLSVGEFATGADDSTPADADRTKFIIGTLKFRTPDTRGLVVKATEAARLSNSVEAGAVGSHTHPGLSSVPTGAHSSSSSALSGAVRFLVNTDVSTPQGSGNVSVTIAGNSTGVENTVPNVASNFYRLI